MQKNKIIELLETQNNEINIVMNSIKKLNAGEDGHIELTKFPLNLDKDIHLLQFSYKNETTKKKEIRNLLIMIKNNIITSRLSDTVHFIEEINMYDFANDQNKYFSIVKQNNIKSLKLKYIKSDNIYITKSEAKAIYKIYNMALQGHSFKSSIENELIFTHESLTEILEENGVL